MIKMSDIQKVSDFEWIIPLTFRTGMNSDVLIIASRTILERSLNDQALEQAVNAAFLPGLVGKVLVMPDIHQGYGFPIGGVAATDAQNGVISPGGIGYDINCGVRLLSSHVEFGEARPFVKNCCKHCMRPFPVDWGGAGCPG